MARVQVQYQGSGEKTQAVMSETIRPVQARFDPDSSGAFQLARALGAIDTRQITNGLQTMEDQQKEKDAQAAQAYANSMTVDELGKRIKEGAVLPSQSPTFVAALQHIHGENVQSSFERDTLSKLQTGELKFSTPQEMEAYLTKGRNDTLAGQSQYTVAGYDKGFNSFREKVMNANTQYLNKEAIEKGAQEFSDNMGNQLLQVTSPDFKGDAAGELVNRYQLLRQSMHLTPDVAREGLAGVATRIATSGNQTLLNEFLDKKLSDGVSVRSVIGDVKAVSLQQHAEAQYDKERHSQVTQGLWPFYQAADKGELDTKALDKYAEESGKYLHPTTRMTLINANQAAQAAQQRAIEKAKLEAAAASSVAAAQQQVAVAVATGKGGVLPDIKVLSPTGELVSFDAKKAKQDSIAAQVQANKLGLEDAAHMYAVNNVENPEWAKVVQTGLSNISSVMRASDGKPVGQLNEEGKASLEMFMRINKVEPRLAEQLAGGGKDYETLSNIQVLMETGYPNINDAAMLVNEANRSGITEGDYSRLKADVQSSVNKVMDPGWFGATRSWISGLFGNSETNLTFMQALITKRAEILMRTGKFATADSAVKATIEHISQQTTKVNNTVYLNKDLPVVPKGEDPAKWLGRFIEEGPAKIAKDQKLSGDVRLNVTADGSYMAWIGTVPLHDSKGEKVIYQQKDISSWIDNTMTADRHFGDAYANFKNRIEGPLTKKMQRKTGLEQSDLYLQNNLLSKEGFKKVLSDGNQNKSLDELMQIYKPKK